MLTLLAVMDEQRLVAVKGGIPWRLPKDVAHFRAYCENKWLLLGRATYAEMDGWFREGHHPLVLTSQCGWDPKVGRVVSSVPHALALAKSAGQQELVCIGGGATFAAALPYADRMLLTFVHTTLRAPLHPVYFPEWSEDDWVDFTIWRQPADESHAHAFDLHELTRRVPGTQDGPSCPDNPESCHTP